MCMYISTCTHTHTLRKNSIILFSLLKFKCLWSNKLIVFDSKLPVDCPSWNILWASLIFKRFAFCLASHLSFFLFSGFCWKKNWNGAKLDDSGDSEREVFSHKIAILLLLRNQGGSFHMGPGGYCLTVKFQNCSRFEMENYLSWIHG